MSARRYRVLHTTGYRYAVPVALSRQMLHLTPRELPTQRVLEHAITVDPAPEESASAHDYFGNAISYIVLSSALLSLSLAATSTFELLPRDAAGLIAGCHALGTGAGLAAYRRQQRQPGAVALPVRFAACDLRGRPAQLRRAQLCAWPARCWRRRWT